MKSYKTLFKQISHEEKRRSTLKERCRGFLMIALNVLLAIIERFSSFVVQNTGKIMSFLNRVVCGDNDAWMKLTKYVGIMLAVFVLIQVIR